MSNNASGGAFRAAACVLALAFMAVAGTRTVQAASNFPDVPIWARAGVWQDSTRFSPNRCVGSFRAPLAESLRVHARAISVRFLRDRSAEARPDFGGYRLYRMTNSPDSSRAILLRRFSLNAGSELTWSQSRVQRSSTLSLLTGNGDGTFAAREELATGVAPIAVAMASVNKADRLLDLGAVNQGSNSVSLMLGRPTGGVASGNEFGTGSGPVALALGDCNADTVADMVTANQASNTISVILSLGIAYKSAVSYSTGLRPSAVAIADMNGDNLPDIVVTNDSSATVSVFLGLAPAKSGLFGTRTDFATGSNPRSLALADVNADSRPDIVITNRGSNTVSVILNVGGGLFAPRADLPTGLAPWSVALGDVNGDNRPDLAVANDGSAVVSVFLGDGLGGFIPRTDFATGTNPRSVAIGDVTGDGFPDLLTANLTHGSVSLLRGDGSGGFAAKSDIPAGTNPHSVAVGDLTGDGNPDLAVANFAYQLPYLCLDAVVNDSIITFVDPDSIGQYRKVCRRPGTLAGPCQSPGDSIFILVPPPGPHDGFLTWYSVTIERKNTTDPDYEDLFLPDTLDAFARCPGAVRDSCPNLNHKLRNLAGPVEPTLGPAANLERVIAVPNPYRGSEVWDQPGQGEVHFINLPSRSVIKIYTAAGDLVRELKHIDNVRDFERWDLKNASGQLVASGIYIYRVEAASFQFQHRLVVIR